MPVKVKPLVWREVENDIDIYETQETPFGVFRMVYFNRSREWRVWVTKDQKMIAFGRKMDETREKAFRVYSGWVLSCIEE